MKVVTEIVTEIEQVSDEQTLTNARDLLDVLIAPHFQVRLAKEKAIYAKRNCRRNAIDIALDGSNLV